ncbi:unnamed protein product [Psylliodes chrysocephalus]|uniref:Monocarboxylate transporter n=1 Tax=Psylliodes chrysocephalus TaxID=3402493 RepID=A0A9P0DCQ8_9CUCU|nr:unnamed protein product [Psylliodes chrysocephala]
MEKNCEQVPEGGWGYLVMVSVFIVHLTAVIPFSTFGLIFGDFMASLGNETSGTTLALSIAIACSCITGFLSSFLLKKYTYRQVGFTGACIQCLSMVLVLFAKNLFLFIISYSIMGGLGSGLMVTAAFSSLNEYFHKKLNLIAGVAQLMITVFTMIYPLLIAYSMKNLGFFYTKGVLVVISFSNIFAAWALHPVEWHIKHFEGRELLQETKSTLNNCKKPLLREEGEREKIIQLSEATKPNEDINNKTSTLSLLKSPKFLNIVIGCAICFSSDNLFIGLIRLVLNDLGFNILDIATMSMVHFACDLVSRIIYVVVSALYPIKNRYVFFVGTLVTIVFRIVFVLHDNYLWRILSLAILGFARCCIQTPYSLVLSEEYRDDFSTALGLFMLASGIISLILGQITNYVKNFTNNDAMFLQVFTVAMIITAISWSIEFIYRLIKKK